MLLTDISKYKYGFAEEKAISGIAIHAFNNIDIMYYFDLILIS
jgi:hypothetical protein